MSVPEEIPEPSALKRAVLAATRRILEPLARLLLEAGIGVGEFHRLAKTAFVRAARDSAPDGHRPNISRIALLTGLNRPEVAELLAKKDESAPEPLRGKQRGERVLAGWWNDPEFQDASGRPAALPLRGVRSFAALVQRYSGEPRVLTLLDELVRVRAVRRLPDGRIEALSRTYATVRWDPASVAAAGDHIGDHLDTVLHNVRHPSRPRYERVVFNVQVDPRYVPMLVRDIASQSDVLADSIDDAINDPQATVRAAQGVQDAVRLGVAIYVFEEPTLVEPEPTGVAEPGVGPRKARKRRRS